MEGGGNIQDIYTVSETEREDDGEDNSDVHEQGCSYSCCHPRGTCHKFIALFFMCFLGFGSYFCYDNPAALKDVFERDLNLNSAEYNLLYSLYSWPNVFLCFIGGFLIDRVFGIRLGTNIYMLLTLLGQIVFATGVITSNFFTMLAGRFIFGIGCESLAVAQNNYAVLWFKGKELNMVFGLQLSFARVGSTVNFWSIGPIYSWVNEYYKGYECLGIVLFIAGITCIISMFCSLILTCLDKRAERIIRRNDNSHGEVVRFTDIKDFPVTFWMITIICVAYYVAIFPFISIAKTFFQYKFHLDSDAANSVNSIVYLISAILSPIAGNIVDRTGKNIFYIGLGVIATLVAHLLLAFSDLNPYIGMSLMGVSYSLLASGLWPLVSLIIPSYQLGTAYGICQAIQNLGLAVIPILTGIIVDADPEYFWVEILFCCSLGVALILTIILWVLDLYRTGTLNMTPKQREKYQKDLLDAEILEAEKLLSASGSNSNGPNERPNSEFHIRNRYLSRIGALLPSHYSISTKGLVYRALR